MYMYNAIVYNLHGKSYWPLVDGKAGKDVAFSDDGKAGRDDALAFDAPLSSLTVSTENL